MGRKRTILDELMVLPWWCSPLAALIAYVGIGTVLPAFVPQDSPAFAAFIAVMSKIAPIVAIALLVPMPFAYLNGHRKKQLVDASKDLESIRALPWREFEQLVAEAYRRKEYTVRENLYAGPDGGVDIRLEKAGQLHLVQCKQWKAQKVGVQVIREMYGTMVAENAQSVSIVTSGIFTQDAKNFAEGKPIDLVDGGQLTNLIASIQVSTLSTRESLGDTEPCLSNPGPCPKCGAELVARMSRRGSSAGKEFIGCSSFPRCRYTQDV